MNKQNSNKWLMLSIVVLSTFMAALDGSIVNVALPKMAKSLEVASSNIQMVATSYLIVISATILILGRLGDMLGKAKIFTIGIGLFTLGSAFCGLAHSFPMLLIARVIQAIGAAGAMATNQGILTEAFPAQERGKALGLLGTSVALGSLVGPGLGGLITGTASWEYIFLINVPIGLIALCGAIKILPRQKTAVVEKLDGAGAVLFMLVIVPLFLSLTAAVGRGFTDPIIVAGILFSILSFVLFLALERKKEDPLVHLELFQNKLFSLSIFCGFITFVAIFCNSIMLPFYLQDVRSYTPQHAGMLLMVYPLILTVVAPLSGHLSDKIGSEGLTFIGLLMISIGLFLMATLHQGTKVLPMILFLSIMSIGMGLFQSPNNSLVMSTVPRNKLGIAGSVNALVRNLGMICGITLATTLLYGMMSLKLGYLVTDYVVGRNDAFIYGMRGVYITAGFICLFGTAMTMLRLIGVKKEKSTDKVSLN